MSLENVEAAREGLPAKEVVEDAVEVFKVLGNPVRLSLMHALAHGELTVGDIARVLELSLSVASHQLARLRRMRLVAARDDGRLTYYRAMDDFVGHLVHDCLAHVGEKLGARGGPTTTGTRFHARAVMPDLVGVADSWWQSVWPGMGRCSSAACRGTSASRAFAPLKSRLHRGPHDLRDHVPAHADQCWAHDRVVVVLERLDWLAAIRLPKLLTPTSRERARPSCRSIPSVSVTDQSSTMSPFSKRLMVMPLKRTRRP